MTNITNLLENIKTWDNDENINKINDIISESSSSEKLEMMKECLNIINDEIPVSFEPTFDHSANTITEALGITDRVHAIIGVLSYIGLNTSEDLDEFFEYVSDNMVNPTPALLIAVNQASRDCVDKAVAAPEMVINVIRDPVSFLDHTTEMYGINIKGEEANDMVDEIVCPSRMIETAMNFTGDSRIDKKMWLIYIIGLTYACEKCGEILSKDGFGALAGISPQEKEEKEDDEVSKMYA